MTTELPLTVDTLSTILHALFDDQAAVKTELTNLRADIRLMHGDLLVEVRRAVQPGPAGEKGDKGDKGDQGERGLQGPKGDPGDVTVRNVFPEGHPLNPH